MILSMLVVAIWFANKPIAPFGLKADSNSEPAHVYELMDNDPQVVSDDIIDSLKKKFKGLRAVLNVRQSDTGETRRDPRKLYHE